MDDYVDYVEIYLLRKRERFLFFFLYFARFSRDLDLVAKRQDWSRIKDVWPWLTGRWSLLC